MAGSGGGLHAMSYVATTAARTGIGPVAAAMRSRNACKTCALGMGGQAGGMVNEAGHFPEFCKKSVQAVAADLQDELDVDRLATLGLAGLAALTPRELDRLGRLGRPLRTGPGDSAYRPISWEEAMGRVADRWRRTAPDRAFLYASGRSSNEAGFLLQLFARAWGTNNVSNCSYYCHQASAVGLGDVLGQGTGTLDLADLAHCDLLVLVGGNPASNHPRFMTVLKDLKRRGGRVVVVNPLTEPGLLRFRVPSDARSLLAGTRIADRYVRPHAGGDAHLLAAVARALLDLEDGGGPGPVDREGLAAHTNGWPDVERHLRALDPAELCAGAGVPPAEVRALAADLAASRATVLAWTMGVTHHRHGSATVRLLALLALMRGMVGRPGAGLLPLRGHSNVQGMGTVGVAPRLRPLVADRLAERLGVTAPAAPGLDTLACLERAHAGGIDAALCLGGNLFGASPDATWTRAALGRVGQVVYLSTALNTGHAHGLGQETIVLPVRARDEEDQPTTQESMFSYVRLSDGGRCRLAHARGEVAVLADLADRVLGTGEATAGRGLDWAGLGDHARVRQAIAEVVPELAGLGTIDESGAEFTIPGRRVAAPVFATPDGRARLAPVALPTPPRLGPDQLRLVTLRSEGQFNGVVYEDEDHYRGQSRRDVVLLHPGDLRRLGLARGDAVRVRSACGEMTVRAAAFAVRRGTCAMYYPEANVLVPRDVDPESRTPAYKSVVVTLARVP